MGFSAFHVLDKMGAKVRIGGIGNRATIPRSVPMENRGS